MILCSFSQDWEKLWLMSFHNGLKKRCKHSKIMRLTFGSVRTMPPAQILHGQKCSSVVITFCPYLGSQHLSADQKIWEGDVSTWKIKRSAGCCQIDFSKHRYSTQNTAVAPTLCSTCPPPKFLAPCSCSQVKYWPLLSPWIRRMNNPSATHEAFPAHVCLSWEALIRCVNTNRHKPSPRFSPCSRQMKCLLIISFFLKPPSSSIHESLSSSISRLSISELEVMG